MGFKCKLFDCIKNRRACIFTEVRFQVPEKYHSQRQQPSRYSYRVREQMNSCFHISTWCTGFWILLETHLDFDVLLLGPASFCFSQIPRMCFVLSLKSLSHKASDWCDQTRHPYDLPDIILLYTPHFNTDARTSLAFSFAIAWERHAADSQFTEAKAVIGGCYLLWHSDT